MRPGFPPVLSSMAVVLVALAVGACGGTERSGDDAEEAPSEAAAESGDASTGALPYVSEVVSFTPGSGAGFGQESMPGVVLGPPAPGPPTAGSLDVLSLGAGGEIVLSFGDRTIVDGPGPDLVVFENPFWVSGDPDNPFAELGAVAVSLDGEQWHEFPCDTELEEGFDTGCAGWRPRLQYDSRDLVPLDPGLCGGDPFDLADLGLSEARFVRIRDLAGGVAPSAGFDLDAIGIVHSAQE